MVSSAYLVGFGAMVTVGHDAVGSPSRWLRRQKTQPAISPAEEKQIDTNRTALYSKDVELRQRAAATLGAMASTTRLAEPIAKDLKPLVNCLRAKEEQGVRLEVLGTLRILVEQGQALAVGMHCHEAVSCLKDEDSAVQRKAAALFRVLAEEGGASFAAIHIPSIMDCFELSQANHSSLLAPLEALAAIASAGEGPAVAQVTERLVAALRDVRPYVRVTGCKALASIARGGGRDLLSHLGLIQMEGIGDSVVPVGGVTLFELLVTLALDDSEKDVRLASADALRCLPEADPDTAAAQKDRRYLPLVGRVRHLVSQHDGEVKSILSTVLGLEEGEECAVCQRGLHWLGGPQSLPCGHAFHARCIEQWFSWKEKCGHARTCPLCRWMKDESGKAARGIN